MKDQIKIDESVKKDLVLNNIIGLYETCSKKDWVQIFSTDIYTNTFSKLPAMFLNNVFKYSDYQHNNPFMLEELIDSYSKRNLPCAFWMPSEKKSTLLAQELENTYKFKTTDTISGMYMNLNSINLDLENVTNYKVVEDDFTDWMIPQTIAFDLSSELSSGFEEINKKIPGMSHFVAYKDKTAVASCSIYLDEKTNCLGVYNDATLPEVREQNVLGKLTKFGLFHLKDQHKSIDHVVVQAAAKNKKLFEDVGFETCSEYQYFEKNSGLK